MTRQDLIYELEYAERELRRAQDNWWQARQAIDASLTTAYSTYNERIVELMSKIGWAVLLQTGGPEFEKPELPGPERLHNRQAIRDYFPDELPVAP